MKRVGIPPAHLCVCGDHAWAPVTKGYVTMVSAEDQALLAAGFWCAHLSTFGQVYAKRKVGGRGGKTVMLHRMVLGFSVPLVDHRSGVGLDNRRDNLRRATKGQNTVNTRKRRSQSGYIGVTRRSGPRGVRYVARISDPVCRHLGAFATAQDAACAYDEAARAAWGEFAALNLPDLDCRAVAEARVTNKREAA